MGCDIHLVLEQKHNGRWVGIDTFNGHTDRFTGKYCSPVARERNYDRFAALAGVRGDGPEPLGVPQDASETTRLLVDKWGSDGHSHSWLPITRAAKVWLRTLSGKPDVFASKYPCSHFFGIDESSSAFVATDYRVIFWFDN